MLTAKGKVEHAISVSKYVYRGSVKYTAAAIDMTTIYKQKSGINRLGQVESLRTEDCKNDCDDYLLDAHYCGIALAHANSDGFRPLNRC